MNSKRILSLVLLLALVVALVGCGKASTSGESTAAATTEATAAATAEATAEATSSEPYTITWYTGGTAQTDIQMVEDAMAKYCNETYGMNIKLDIVATPFGDLGQKMSLVLSSGEDWDLCFTATWANNFATNVANGAYLDLTDLLPQYAPDLYKFVGNYWPAATVNGKILAVPNIQCEYKWAFSSIPTQWVTMYNTANPGKELKQENIKHRTDLADFFYWCKTNVIDAGVTLNGVAPKYAVYGGITDQYSYLMEDTGYGDTYFQFGDAACKVKTIFDFPDYIDALNTVNRWYNDGLIQSDIATAQKTNTDLATLQWMEFDHPTFKVGEDSNQYNYWGLDQSKNELTFFTYGDAWANTGAVTATMTAVNANCKNPQVVLQFLNYLNTDATLFNMICFGVEGYHYTLADDGTVVTSTENTGYDPNADWSYGNQFLAHPRAGQAADIWTETEKMNETCNISSAMGFSADPTNIQTQIANVSVVMEQYKGYIATGALQGSADDWTAYLNQYKTDLTNAGQQDIVNEIQTQVDAWLAAKK